MNKRRRIAITQRIYYAAAGLWPIAHLPSFEAITGPKPEGWLVKTVGALVTATGATLVAAGLRDRITPEIEGLAVASALSLGAVDVVYASARRISPIYLADAVVEAALVAGWVATHRPARALPARRPRQRLDVWIHAR
jgi:hypothetical protein